MFAVAHLLPYNISMRCPKCGYEISDDQIVREAGAIRGRKGTGATKARNSEKMRAAGRLGGLARARNLRAAAQKLEKAKLQTEEASTTKKTPQRRRKQNR
jgi:hypothetical protein